MIIDANKSIHIKKIGQQHCNSDILDISNCDDVNWFNCTFSTSILMLNIGSCPFFCRKGQLENTNVTITMYCQSYLWVFGYMELRSCIIFTVRRSSFGKTQILESSSLSARVVLCGCICTRKSLFALCNQQCSIIMIVIIGCSTTDLWQLSSKVFVDPQCNNE